MKRDRRRWSDTCAIFRKHRRREEKYKIQVTLDESKMDERNRWEEEPPRRRKTKTTSRKKKDTSVPRSIVGRKNGMWKINKLGQEVAWKLDAHGPQAWHRAT